jgi:hypothetical protein
VLKVRPLDTLFTSYDEPFWVDIECDGYTTIDVYVYGSDTPFNSISVTPPYTRARVWSENPIAVNPTNQVHKITFKNRYTSEQVDIWIAYLAPRLERVEFRPARGINLMGQVTQMAIIGDYVFFRSYGSRRFAPVNAPNHAKVYHEFVGFNENGEKFYHIDRQDRILAQLGGGTDLYITLNPITEVPVTLEFDLARLVPLLDITIPGLSKDSALVRGFINYLGGFANYVTGFSMGVARFISSRLGITHPIVGAKVEAGAFRITYLADPFPLKTMLIMGAVIIAGSVAAIVIAQSLRDIIIERELTIRTVEVMNAIRDVVNERARITGELIRYAREQGLTPEQLASLFNALGPFYESPDITGAISALGEAERWKNEAERWKREAESKSRERYIWALGGAGVGAVLYGLAKG